MLLNLFSLLDFVALAISNLNLEFPNLSLSIVTGKSNVISSYNIFPNEYISALSSTFLASAS